MMTISTLDEASLEAERARIREEINNAAMLEDLVRTPSWARDYLLGCQAYLGDIRSGREDWALKSEPIRQLWIEATEERITILHQAIEQLANQ